jgi:hypothetical protein
MRRANDTWDDLGKYTSGYRWVVVHGDEPLSFSKTTDNARVRLSKSRTQNPEIKDDLEIIAIETGFTIPDHISDEKVLAEIERITELLLPVTKEEEDTVKEVALNNVMMQDLKHIIKNASTEA